MKIGNVVETGGNILIGAAVVFLAPLAIAVLAGAAKPIAKAAIKGSMAAYEGVKNIAADARESIGKITTEAKSEIAETEEKIAETVAEEAA